MNAEKPRSLGKSLLTTEQRHKVRLLLKIRDRALARVDAILDEAGASRHKYSRRAFIRRLKESPEWRN